MTDASPRHRNTLIYLCLALVTASIYWPVRHFGFVNYDDPLYVTQNPHLQWGLTLRSVGWAFTTPLDQWMPLTWLGRILECRFFGLDAGAHHVVNVLFHIANTLLLFGVLKRMTDAPWRSALVAALFAVHPLHVESVAWVTGLKDVLSMFLGLLTIWAYVRYVELLNLSTGRDALPREATLPRPTRLTWRRVRWSLVGTRLARLRRVNPASVAPTPSRGAALPSSIPSTGSGQAKAERSTLHMYFYALTLGLFALALMAKPMMVTLPFVLLLLDYWPLGRTRWAQPAPTQVSGPATGVDVATPVRRLIQEKLPFFALTAASCVVTYWAQRGLGTVPSLKRFPLELRVVNALLSYVHYVCKAVWPTGLAVFYPLDTSLSLAAAVVACFGLTGATVAVLAAARRSPWLATGWFWYLGTLLPVIGLVQVGSQSMADRYTYVPLVGLFIMLSWSLPGVATQQRIRKVIACIGVVAVLAACAALSRVQLGYWTDSETLFQHALAVTRDNWLAHYNLGVALEKRGRLNDAIGHYEQAVRIRRDYAEACNNLGGALARTGRAAEAIKQYEQALRIDPDLAVAHYNLGIALKQAGRLPEAIGQYEQALRIKPDYAEAYNNLGNALWQAGKPQDAIAKYEQAVRFKPDFAEAHRNLGVALMRLGRIPEAARHFEETLRIEPNSADAHYSLGLASEQTGKLSEAIWHYERVLQITPNAVEAQNNLAWLLATLAPAEGGNPARAVTLAQRACELTGNRLAAYLDTLAAAYAAVGRFTDAVTAAEKAIELARSAGQPQVVKEIQARLELYRGGRPYRRPIDPTDQLNR